MIAQSRQSMHFFKQAGSIWMLMGMKSTDITSSHILNGLFFFFFSRKGLNARQAEFTMKKYRSHCHCGLAVIMSVDVLLN